MAGSFSRHFDPSESSSDDELADLDLPRVDYSDATSVFKALGAGSGPGSLPMPRMVSPKEVRQQSKTMSWKIFEDWEVLGKILDRHEATIRKRWAKKTKNQRVCILTSAWPKMSAQHRPDFAAFRNETPDQRDLGTRFRDAYLWPYINLEDLSKPKSLPLFLNSRARNTPDAFALADCEATHLGVVTKAIMPDFLNVHTMMFTNRRTPSTYGELIPWDENDEACDWLMSGRGVHPGEGLLILEIQQRIMSFLLECCKLIMHDVPAEDLMNEKAAILPPPAFADATEDGFASLVVLHAEAPYRVPAELDWVRLRSLFAAMHSAAEDHV